MSMVSWGWSEMNDLGSPCENNSESNVLVRHGYMYFLNFS